MWDFVSPRWGFGIVLGFIPAVSTAGYFGMTPPGSEIMSSFLDKLRAGSLGLYVVRGMFRRLTHSGYETYDPFGSE
jgi:hypothetical protein